MFTLRGMNVGLLLVWGHIRSHNISEGNRIATIFRYSDSVPDDKKMTTANMLKVMQLPTVTFMGQKSGHCKNVYKAFKGKYIGVSMYLYFYYAFYNLGGSDC